MTYPLKYLHDNEIAHSELNDKNIFIDAKNRVRMGDFCKSRISKTCGSTKDDIFSLGVIVL